MILINYLLKNFLTILLLSFILSTLLLILKINDIPNIGLKDIDYGRYLLFYLYETYLNISI